MRWPQRSVLSNAAHVMPVVADTLPAVSAPQAASCILESNRFTNASVVFRAASQNFLKNMIDPDKFQIPEFKIIDTSYQVINVSPESNALPGLLPLLFGQSP